MIQRQGETWWAEAGGKRRPILVVTRDHAVEVLNRIIVAPVTRTVRNIETEIPLGVDNGLDVECVAAFDNLQPIRRSSLTTRVGRLHSDQRDEICRAIRAVTDC